MTSDYEALRRRALEDARRSRTAAKAAAAAAAREAKQERADIDLNTDHLLDLLRPYERALFDDGLRLEVIESTGNPANNSMRLRYRAVSEYEGKWSFGTIPVEDIEVTSVPPVYRIHRLEISTDDAAEIMAHMLKEAARVVPLAKEQRKKVGWFEWYFAESPFCGFVTRR